MDPQGRRRRNWIIFWLAVVGIPLLLYLAVGLFLALTVDFSEPG
jgi:hypothetical protein